MQDQLSNVDDAAWCAVVPLRFRCRPRGLVLGRAEKIVRHPGTQRAHRHTRGRTRARGPFCLCLIAGVHVQFQAALSLPCPLMGSPDAEVGAHDSVASRCGKLRKMSDRSVGNARVQHAAPAATSKHPRSRLEERVSRGAGEGGKDVPVWEEVFPGDLSR